MELALYDPEVGYYARAAQRSGRAGDFFTSVDVGPVFGELLEVQVAEMADIVTTSPVTQPAESSRVRSRRSRRGQRTAVGGHPARGATARSVVLRTHPPSPGRGQRRRPRRRSATCSGDGAERLVVLVRGTPRVLRRRPGRERTARCAAGASGRDAARRPARGLRRRLVTAIAACRSKARRRRPSSPRTSIGSASTLEPGWRVEINLRAVEWMRAAARRLTRGFIIVIDYGHGRASSTRRRTPAER